MHAVINERPSSRPFRGSGVEPQFTRRCGRLADLDRRTCSLTYLTFARGTDRNFDGDQLCKGRHSCDEPSVARHPDVFSGLALVWFRGCFTQKRPMRRRRAAFAVRGRRYRNIQGGRSLGAIPAWFTNFRRSGNRILRTIHWGTLRKITIDFCDQQSLAIEFPRSGTGADAVPGGC